LCNEACVSATDRQTTFIPRTFTEFRISIILPWARGIFSFLEFPHSAAVRNF